ncbi:hypothetical protein [Burkholderia ubonensis]|uniref:hypothetical protein n=1 Tax=Burkholderia ubonensis TaxID=101571 RepID=UPI0012FBB03C|nr:hypothetical protein [Burkholderia ubonensis]
MVPPTVLADRSRVWVALAAATVTLAAFSIGLGLGVAVLLCVVFVAWCGYLGLGPDGPESRFSVSPASIVWFAPGSRTGHIAMRRIERVCLITPCGRRVALLSRRAATVERRLGPSGSDRDHPVRWGLVVEVDGHDHCIARRLPPRTVISLARAVRRALRLAVGEEHRA